MSSILTALRGSARLLSVAAGAAGAVRAMRPPAPAGGDRDSGGFSAHRAESHLRAIAEEPRPTGSAGAEKARLYLVEQLRQSGWEVHVQDTIAVQEHGRMPYGPRNLAAGRVRNVIARLPGTRPGRPAVLLMSHYDSVAQGPGASDAGVPASALVETARALAVRDRLQNDVLIVLTEGEELGLLGADAFFKEEPLARRVGVMLNFEARGTSGPVLMFETGPRSADLVAALARTGTPVFADSLFGEVYRRVPNSTDFAIGSRQALPGLNFAHIGDFANYHTPLDDVEHLDRGSLQHHGEVALGLAVALGDVDLDTLRDEDPVYLSIGRGKLVRYPRSTAAPLALAAAAVTATGVRLWARRHGVSARSVAAGLAGLGARLITGAGSAQLLTTALGRIRPEARRHGDFYRSNELFATLGLMAAASTCFGQTSPAPAAADIRQVAATAPLAAAALACAARVPGAAHVATWPLLGAGLGLVLSSSQRPAMRALGAVTATVPAIAVLVPRAKLVYEGLTPRVGAAPATAVLQLAGELAAPLLWRHTPTAVRRSALGACVVAAAGLLAWQFRLRRATSQHPHPSSLSYLVDADRRTAFWLSSDAAVGPGTRFVLGDRPGKGRLDAYFPGWERDFLHTRAPALDLPAPAVDVVSEVPTGEGRRIVLDVHSPRGARQISLALHSGTVRTWSVEGRTTSGGPSTQSGPGDWELWLHAVPEEGFRIKLELTTDPVSLRVADRSDVLPDITGNGVPLDRPPGYVGAAGLDVEGWSGGTLVVTTVRL